MNHLRAFRTLFNFAWTISEAAIYKLIKEEFSYEIIGAEWLEQLGAAPGAIVLTAHMGNYDLGAALVCGEIQPRNPHGARSRAGPANRATPQCFARTERAKARSKSTTTPRARCFPSIC